MRFLPLVAMILFLSGCGVRKAPQIEYLCRPSGMEAKKIDFGFFDYSGRIESVYVSEDAGTGRFKLSLQLTETGTKMFGRMTSDHVGELMPITVDGEVVSSPRIQERILSGQIAITGDFTKEAATELALKMAPACPSS